MAVALSKICVKVWVEGMCEKSMKFINNTKKKKHHNCFFWFQSAITDQFSDKYIFLVTVNCIVDLDCKIRPLNPVKERWD